MKNLLFLFTFIACASVNAQLSSVQHGQITDVVREWNEKDHPGGVLGIMKDGEVIYTEAFGLANIEYGIPNTTETRFNVASVSKQFTAMAIVRLEEEGKLSFDDEIQKYLPNIPKFKHKITIRDLMHHTSGLRSLHGMLEMAGWRDMDPRTTDDLFRFMENQTELNFEPGSEYLYCNTGYNFMAKIVENITGAGFIWWTRERIFKPLGMENTYFEEDYSRVVPNNASSYYKGTDGFKKAIPYWGYIGSGNSHTTVSDLMIWYKNFNHPTAGWENAFKTLQTKDPLNDGSENDYAFGIVVQDYKGVQRIQHGGGIGGYRSFASLYPEQDLCVIMLTNFSSSDVRHKAEVIAEQFLELPEIEDPKLKPAILLSTEALKKYEGHYWNDRKAFPRELKVENDTLWYVRSKDSRTALTPLGNHQFRMNSPNAFIIEFDVTEATDKKMIVGVYSNDVGHFESYKPCPPKYKDLKAYVGAYYSTELDTKYTISLEDGALKLYQKRLGDLEMEVKHNDVAVAEWPLGILRFKRNRRGKIIGMSATNGRVKNLWFDKE